MTEIMADIDFVQMARDVACIKQAVMGNGEPGLCKRVEDLEAKEKKRGYLVGICTGFGSVCGYLINNFIDFLKGV